MFHLIPDMESVDFKVELIDQERSKVIKKVPGEVKAVGRLGHEAKKKTFQEEIKNKTLQELEELLKRQENILKNKNLVEKLPDKGDKIKSNIKTIKGIIIF